MDKLHDSRKEFSGVVLNAGAYTHYSYALADAIKAINIPVIEVHISNIFARDEFRSKSVIAPVCAGSISGFGLLSYEQIMMERIQKLVKLLENHADCALITDDVNRRYFTGMKSSAGYVLIFPEKSYLLIDFRYIEKARQTVKHCEVIEQKTNVFQQISELLQKHQAKTIALESDTLPMGKAHKIMMHLKNYEFLTDETLSRAVYQLRTIKSADEIQKIKSAQRLAEEALQHLLQELHAGMTEREVALALDFVSGFNCS